MGWQQVASIEDAEAASPWVAARVGRQDLVLARLGDEWFAAEGQCTHAGCAFKDDGSLEAGAIVCNCHGSEFDLRTGEVRRGPAEYDLRTFPVRVVDGHLEVDI